MPIIELWRGIKFKMYIADHNPPHFHAFYQGVEALYTIRDCECLAGQLPHRINKLVIKWWEANREHLITKWEDLND